MPTQIYVNLPVKNLNQSIKFFTQLGYTLVYGRYRHLHDCVRGYFRHVVDRGQIQDFYPKSHL